MVPNGNLNIKIDAAFFRLQIYKRWGEMIFESKSPDYPWDGKLKNGHQAPMMPKQAAFRYQLFQCRMVWILLALVLWMLV